MHSRRPPPRILRCRSWHPRAPSVPDAVETVLGEPCVSISQTRPPPCPSFRSRARGTPKYQESYPGWIHGCCRARSLCRRRTLPFSARPIALDEGPAQLRVRELENQLVGEFQVLGKPHPTILIEALSAPPGSCHPSWRSYRPSHPDGSIIRLLYGSVRLQEVRVARLRALQEAQVRG